MTFLVGCVMWIQLDQIINIILRVLQGFLASVSMDHNNDIRPWEPGHRKWSLFIADYPRNLYDPAFFCRDIAL